MKRLVAVACLALTASLVTAPVAQADVQERRAYRCTSATYHTYVGLESPILHLRWGDLITKMRVCTRRSNGTVMHKKTRASMEIRPNGVSESFGTHWSIYRAGTGGFVDGVHQNYQEKQRWMGTFRNCQGIGSARICGPTGHFTVIMVFTAKRLRAWEPGSHNKWALYRRAGEPNGSTDDFDRKIRFYNTP